MNHDFWKEEKNHTFQAKHKCIIYTFCLVYTKCYSHFAWCWPSLHMFEQSSQMYCLVWHVTDFWVSTWPSLPPMCLQYLELNQSYFQVNLDPGNDLKDDFNHLWNQTCQGLFTKAWVQWHHLGNVECIWDEVHRWWHQSLLAIIF